jgi:hypothetical protein
LLIVLGFVVMLLTLLLAYFSKGTLQNQISSSSSNIVREDLIARTAIDTVISDLKGEIAYHVLRIVVTVWEFCRHEEE